MKLNKEQNMKLNKKEQQLVNRFKKLLKPYKLRIPIDHDIQLNVTLSWELELSLSIKHIELILPHKSTSELMNMSIYDLLFREMTEKASPCKWNWNYEIGEAIRKTPPVRKTEQQIEQLCDDCDTLVEEQNAEGKTFNLDAKKAVFFERLCDIAQRQIKKRIKHAK